jgi:enamine deaminase RidA (YjgF/YER057c/UK114 family)
MSARARGVGEPEALFEPTSDRQAQSSVQSSAMVFRRQPADSAAGEGFSSIQLGNSRRLSLMLVPRGRGSFKEQAREILSIKEQLLEQQSCGMTVTAQTVFLRDPDQLALCEKIFSDYYGAHRPVMSFVFQPPCCGAALALEAWAIGGEDVQVERFGSNTLAVTYNGMRWIHCAGIRSTKVTAPVYQQAMGVLEHMRSELEKSGSGFQHVLRTWFYLGGITETEGGVQRYKELNRARTDFYRDVDFHCTAPQPSIPQGIYPASTAVGSASPGLAAGCLALQTRRQDALLLPLENPQQTPAYAYHPRHSPQSPKFSRGVALVLDNYTTTWLSGTASVVHSISRHAGDIVRQTEQTIENIQRLISAENFVFHGIQHSGAQLSDLAKIRVYLKRAEDFSRCRAVCEQRFGLVPAIYAMADICRPELLVEIEGVAFTKAKS